MKTKRVGETEEEMRLETKTWKPDWSVSTFAGGFNSPVNRASPQTRLFLAVFQRVSSRHGPS